MLWLPSHTNKSQLVTVLLVDGSHGDDKKSFFCVFLDNQNIFVTNEWDLEWERPGYKPQLHHQLNLFQLLLIFWKVTCHHPEIIVKIKQNNARFTPSRCQLPLSLSRLGELVFWFSQVNSWNNRGFSSGRCFQAHLKWQQLTIKAKTSSVRFSFRILASIHIESSPQSYNTGPTACTIFILN